MEQVNKSEVESNPQTAGETLIEEETTKEAESLVAQEETSAETPIEVETNKQDVSAENILPGNVEIITEQTETVEAVVEKNEAEDIEKVEKVQENAIVTDAPQVIEDVQSATVETVSSLVQPTSAETEIMDCEADMSCASGMLKNLEKSGLGLLSQYDSGDESDDSVVETPVLDNYRSQIVEINSDSSDDSDVEITDQYKELNKIIDVGDDEDEDEDGSGKAKKPLRVKGELLLEDLPPIQDLQITVPEVDCVELGTISSIIDQLVLVKTLPGSLLLNLETVLFLEKGQKVLGAIFDVLGQVADPLYCIRFNSNKEIKDKNIEIGQKVYVAPKTEHTQFIILSNLTSIRGSDASWENDVEPPEKHLDYSDDEEEREARRSLRNKDRPTDHVDLTKRSRPNAQAGPSGYAPRHNRPPPQHYGGYNRPHGQQQHYNPNFQYQNAGNSWHSNFQYGQSQYYPPQQPQVPQHPPPSFVVNPYAMRSQSPYMPGHVMPPPQPYYQNNPPPHHHQPPPQ